MAVIVELDMAGASVEQLYEAEAVAGRRGEEKGGPPYDGCMFLAVTLTEDGARLLAASRTEDGFRRVLDEALATDLAAAGLEVSGLRVTSAVSMAIPGVHQ